MTAPFVHFTAFRLLYVCLLFAGHANAGVEDEKWYLYQSKNFQIYSNDKHKEVVENIRKLELFRTVALTLLGHTDAKPSKHSTRIFLFRRLSQMQKLFKLEENVAGFYRPQFPYNLMVTADIKSSWTKVNELIFHEYVHELSRSLTRFRYPAWYDEGLAQALSTMVIRDGQVILGIPPIDRTYGVCRSMPMSLEAMFKVNFVSQVMPGKACPFYARSWLFVHYLIFSKDARLNNYAHKVPELLTRINTGESYDDVLHDLFGMSVAAMDKHLHKYARGEALKYAIDANYFNFDPSYERRRLNSSETKHALADAAVSNNPVRARRFWSKLLKTEPSDGKALAGMSRSYGVGGMHEQSLDYAAQAIRVAPGDHVSQLAVARALLDSCLSQSASQHCESEDTNQKMLTHAKQAYLLEANAETSFIYAYHLMQAGHYEAALGHFEYSLSKQPANAYATKWVGYAHYKLGNLPQAQKYLELSRLWLGHVETEAAWINGILNELKREEVSESFK